MITNTPRTWTIGVAVLAALLIVASWFLLIQPIGSGVAALKSQAATASTANDQLAVQVATLRREYVKLPQQQATLAVLQEHLPAKLALSALTELIDTEAATSGVQVTSIAPGAPTVVTSTAGTAATTSTTSTSTTSASTTSTLVSDAVAIDVTGSFAQTQVFLEGLQTMDRDFLVSQISLKATGSSTSARATSGNVELTVTGNVFVLPSTSASSATSSAATSSPATS